MSKPQERTRTIYDDIPPVAPASAAPAAEQDPPPAPVAPRTRWRTMATAPRNGTIVWLVDSLTKDDGEMSRWYSTREMRDGKWAHIGWWVAAIGRAKIQFDPAGWRPING